MLTLEIMFSCNQNVNGGKKRVHLRLLVFVRVEVSFISDLAQQFKGVDPRAARAIPKCWTHKDLGSSVF